VELLWCVVGAIQRGARTNKDDGVRADTQLKVIIAGDGLSEIFGITDSEYSVDRDGSYARILDD
jgi:hypothetical protein